MKALSRFSQRKRVQLSFEGTEVLTKQSFKKEVDVNNIVNKYKQTGLITHIRRSQPVYSDVSGIGDYQEALNVVANAQEAFMNLPANVRATFKNDPGLFLQYAQNPANAEQMVKLGLAARKEKKDGQNSSGIGIGTPSTQSGTVQKEEKGEIKK